MKTIRMDYDEHEKMKSSIKEMQAAIDLLVKNNDNIIYIDERTVRGSAVTSKRRNSWSYELQWEYVIPRLRTQEEMEIELSEELKSLYESFDRVEKNYKEQLKEIEENYKEELRIAKRGFFRNLFNI